MTNERKTNIGVAVILGLIVVGIGYCTSEVGKDLGVERAESELAINNLYIGQPAEALATDGFTWKLSERSRGSRTYYRWHVNEKVYVTITDGRISSIRRTYP